MAAAVWLSCAASGLADLAAAVAKVPADRVVHFSASSSGVHAIVEDAPDAAIRAVRGLAEGRAADCEGVAAIDVADGRWDEVMNYVRDAMGDTQRFFVASPGRGRLVLAGVGTGTRAAVEAARTLARPEMENSTIGTADVESYASLPELAAPESASASASDDDAPPAVVMMQATTPEQDAASFWWADRAAELLEVAAKAGAPVFAYSVGEVEARLARLTSLRNVGRVFYAMKANWHPAVLRAVYEAGAGFECVSTHEVRHVLSTFPNIERTRLLYTPNFASRADYEYARRQSVFVTVDNTGILERWPDVFRGARIIVRIDTGVGLGHHVKVTTGGPRSKFGVTAQQLLELAPLLEQNGTVVSGLHVHAGSGITDAGNWARNAADLATLLPNFPQLRFLNLGGGLGVPYRPTDEQLDLDAVDARLGELRERMGAETCARLEFWLEPGRYVAAQAGVMLARVNQLKAKSGKRFVGLEAGMNALMRPALYESYHHVVNLTRLGRGGPTAVFDVVGPVCESGDILARARELPDDTAEGDWFLVATCGAYARCMSSNYNMLPFLEEVELA